jgi:hypothetical protein
MVSKVTLVVNDLEQLTMLEYMLVNANIEYTLELNDGKYSITPPYLIIHGVPIDEQRSLEWIKEQTNE